MDKVITRVFQVLANPQIPQLIISISCWLFDFPFQLIPTFDFMFLYCSFCPRNSPKKMYRADHHIYEAALVIIKTVFLSND